MAPSPLHPPPPPKGSNPQRRRRPLSTTNKLRKSCSASQPRRKLMDIVLGVVRRLGHTTGVSMLDIECASVHDNFLPDRRGTRDLLRYGVKRAVREGRLQCTSGGLYRLPPTRSEEEQARSRTPPPPPPLHRGRHDLYHCPSFLRKRWCRRGSLRPAPPRSMYSFRDRPCNRTTRKSPEHWHPPSFTIPTNRKSPEHWHPPSFTCPSSERRNVPPTHMDHQRDEIPSFAFKEAVVGSMGGSNAQEQDECVEGDGGVGGFAEREWGRRDGGGGGGSRRSLRSEDILDDLSDDEGTDERFDNSRSPPHRRRDDGPGALPKVERRRDGDHGRAAAAALFILASDIVKVIAQKASNKLNSLSLEPHVGGGLGGGGTVIGGCEGGGGPGSGGGGLGDGRSGEGGSYGGPDFDFCGSSKEGPAAAAKPGGSEGPAMDAAAAGASPEPDVEEAGRVVLQGAAALSEISTHLGQGAARVLNVSANGGSHTESGEKKEAIFKAFQVAAMDIVRVARVFVNPTADKNEGDEDHPSPFLSATQRDDNFEFDGGPRRGGACPDEDANCDRTMNDLQDAADMHYDLPGSSSTFAINIRSENNHGEINTNMEVFIQNLMHDMRLLARRVSSCISQ